MTSYHRLQEWLILCHLLAEDNGIKLIIDPNATTAGTDGQRVILPSLSEQRDQTIATAFLVHECGHINETEFISASEFQSPLHFGIYNVLEDVRMELRQMQRYPGSKALLANAVTLLVQQGFFKPVANDSHAAEKLLGALLYHLRAQVLGQTAVAEYAKQACMLLRDELGDLRFGRFLLTAMRVTTAIASTDCKALAATLLALLAEQSPESPDKLDEPSPDQVEPGDDGDIGPEPESARTDAGNAPNEPCGPGGSDAAQSFISEALDATEEHIPNHLRDFGQALSPGFETAAKSNESIIAETVCPTSKPVDQDMLDDALSIAPRLTRELVTLVESTNRVYKRSATMGRRLNPRVLHRVCTNDPRLYRASEHRRGTNASVVLLIDGSGSMDYETVNGNTQQTGIPARVATQSAYAVASALFLIRNVSCAVARFPALGHETGVERLCGMGESPAANSQFFAPSASGTTPMAEAIAWSTLEHRRHPHGRQVTICVSDGEPDNVQATASAIQFATDQGINVIGIGIRTDAVNGLFHDAIVIQTITELPDVLFERLRKYL